MNVSLTTFNGDIPKSFKQSLLHWSVSFLHLMLHDLCEFLCWRQHILKLILFIFSTPVSRPKKASTSWESRNPPPHTQAITFISSIREEHWLQPLESVFIIEVFNTCQMSFWLSKTFFPALHKNVLCKVSTSHSEGLSKTACYKIQWSQFVNRNKWTPILTL